MPHLQGQRRGHRLEHARAHKRYGASSYGGYRCQGTATTAPDGAALEWLRGRDGVAEGARRGFRAMTERATKNAEHLRRHGGGAGEGDRAGEREGDEPVNAPAHVRHPSTGRVHLLTSSRFTTWQRCPRAHHYRYEAGIVSCDRQSAALAFGTAIHAGLESWWLTIQAGDPGRALSGALEAAEMALWTCGRNGEEPDPYDLARLTALLCAYDARWQSWACGTEVLAVERRLSTSSRTRSPEMWRRPGASRGRSIFS
jgi:hypothetical protein